MLGIPSPLKSMRNETPISASARWQLSFSTLLLAVALFASFSTCDAQSPSPVPPDPPPPSPPGPPNPNINVDVLACGTNMRTTSLLTPSVSPVPNALVLVWVGSTTSVPTNIPVVSGGGMTWDLVETHIRGGGSRRLSVFRGRSSTPSGGLLTIDFDGQEQQVIGWGVVQHTGLDLSGENGSGAVVQTGVNAARGFDTFATVSLAPFSGGGNATVGGFLVGTGEDIAPGDGFIDLLENGQLGRRVMVEYQPSSDTTVDASWTEAAHWIGIALELKATTNGAAAGSFQSPTIAQLSTCESSQSLGVRKAADSRDDAPRRPPRRGPKGPGRPH